MIVSSVLASAAVPDHNLIFKTIPILSLVLPLGLIFAQSGMTSAFMQHPLRAGCFSSWQIFRIWKRSMTGEMGRGKKKPFTWNFKLSFKKPLHRQSEAPSMHYQLTLAWLDAEYMIIKNLMTTKSQETHRENFSHKFFKFTLFIQT